jgi:hypothetical protein
MKENVWFDIKEEKTSADVSTDAAHPLHPKKTESKLARRLGNYSTP